MSKELSMPVSPATRTVTGPAAIQAGTQTEAQRWLRAVGIVLAGSVFVAACAHIALPLFFTPVPLTMQTFAVLLLGLLLSPRLAGAALVAYLLEGVVGLPVFAPGPTGSAGLAHLLGPTGGYLLSYPLAATLTSLVFRHTRRGFGIALLVTTAGSLVILACGATWFGIYIHEPVRLIATQTVLPFLPGDALKIAAAAGVAVGIGRLRRSK